MALLTYNECGFLIPKQNNWQDVHKSVFDIAVDGKDVDSNRDFIYSVTDHPSLNENLFVTLRSQSRLSDSLDMSQEQIMLEVGKSITVKFDISARKSVSTTASEDGSAPKRSKCTYVSAPEYESWIKQLLSTRGLDASDVRFFSIEKRYVQKGKNEFFIPKVSFLVKGIITDTEKLSSAWLEGIGRSRGYGLGLLEIYADA